MRPSDVFVPVIPLVETAPPTDVLATPEGPSAPGSSLLLILAVLGGIVLVIGFVTPVPAVVRRRNRARHTAPTERPPHGAGLRPSIDPASPI